MFKFFLRYRNVSVLAAVLLVQFVLLGYQVKRQDDVRLLRVWTVGAISPIQKGLNLVTSGVVNTWRDYIWLVGARHQNEQLRGQVSRLKLENQQFRRALARFDRDHPQNQIVEWGHRHGVRVLDLLPILREAELAGHTYHLRDTHWNARGNRLAGEALAEKLMAY